MDAKLLSALADLMADVAFKDTGPDMFGNRGPQKATMKSCATGRCVGFLYDADFPAWFLALTDPLSTCRNLRELVMNMQMGTVRAPIAVTMAEGFDRVAWREMQEGQLSALAHAVVACRAKGFMDGAALYFDIFTDHLELDGYAARDGKIVKAESEANEVQVEEVGELVGECKRLGLPNYATIAHHIDTAEKRYLDGDAAGYHDCIGNSRNAYERTLEDVAEAWSKRTGSAAISPADLKRPVWEQAGVPPRRGRVDPARVRGVLEALRAAQRDGWPPRQGGTKGQARIFSDAFRS